MGWHSPCSWGFNNGLYMESSDCCSSTRFRYYGNCGDGKFCCDSNHIVCQGKSFGLNLNKLILLNLECLDGFRDVSGHCQDINEYVH